MRAQVACAVLLATGTALISAAATTPTGGDAAPVLVALHHHQLQEEQQQQQQNPLVDPSARAHPKSQQQNANHDQDRPRQQDDDGWMAPVVVEAGAQAGQSMGAVVLFVVGAAGVFAMGLV